jgi:hypothetical protein
MCAHCHNNSSSNNTHSMSGRRSGGRGATAARPQLTQLLARRMPPGIGRVVRVRAAWWWWRLELCKQVGQWVSLPYHAARHGAGDEGGAHAHRRGSVCLAHSRGCRRGPSRQRPQTRAESTSAARGRGGGTTGRVRRPCRRPGACACPPCAPSRGPGRLHTLSQSPARGSPPSCRQHAAEDGVCASSPQGGRRLAPLYCQSR